MNILLIGGPHDGRVSTADKSPESIKIDNHEYKPGANLPDDIKDRVGRAFAGRFEVYGYAGPDAEAIRALQAEFAEKQSV